MSHFLNSLLLCTCLDFIRTTWLGVLSYILELTLIVSVLSLPERNKYLQLYRVRARWTRLEAGSQLEE